MPQYVDQCNFKIAGSNAGSVALCLVTMNSFRILPIASIKVNKNCSAAVSQSRAFISLENIVCHDLRNCKISNKTHFKWTQIPRNVGKPAIGEFADCSQDNPVFPVSLLVLLKLWKGNSHSHTHN